MIYDKMKIDLECKHPIVQLLDHEQATKCKYVYSVRCLSPEDGWNIFCDAIFDVVFKTLEHLNVLFNM